MITGSKGGIQHADNHQAACSIQGLSKLTISYFLLVLLTVSLLSSVLFSLFSRSTIKEIERNSRAMLSQITYASDVVYNQVMTIGNTLLIQPEILTFLDETVEDKVSNYHIFQQIEQIANLNPYIHSIGIHRPSTGTTIDTAGLPFDASLTALSAKQYMEFNPRSLKVASRNSGRPLQFLTFLLYPNFAYQTTGSPLIYINVEEQSILATIRKIGKVDAANNVFVINNEGKVLSHTDSNLFLDDLSGEEYVRTILIENQPENSFTTTIANKKSLVTYVKSEELDWYFVSVSPYSELISDIDRLRSITLQVTAGIVLAGLLLSILLTSNMNRPLTALLEKVMPNPVKPASGLALIDEYKMMNEVFQSYHEREKSMQFVINHSSRTVQSIIFMPCCVVILWRIRSQAKLLRRSARRLRGRSLACWCSRLMSLSLQERGWKGNSRPCYASRLGISPKSCWNISAPVMFSLWEETKRPPSFNTRKISSRRS